MYHLFRGNTTRAAVRATWAWDKAPLVQKEDKLAFAWSGDFLPIFSESIIKIEHINENGIVLGREEKGIYKDTPGQGCEFNTSLAPYLGRARGAAYVALENANMKVHKCRVKTSYLHNNSSYFSFSISIYALSFNLPSKEIINMGEGSVTFRA